MTQASESAANLASSANAALVYQGQFGEFTIEDRDRREVILYRAGLSLAAASFAIAAALTAWNPASPAVLNALTLLYGLFWTGLGLSLYYIHIYLKPLHRTLQAFWLIGGVASSAIALTSAQPLALQVYEHPRLIWGVGFTFAALTGIFFKEAFCFNRVETKVLTPLVPLLLLGHLSSLLQPGTERVLLVTWAIGFALFAGRKLIQPIPPDIGDKSVFEYLAQQKQKEQNS